MEDFDLMIDEQHRCVLLDATADADCPKASWADRVLQRLNVEAKRTAARISLQAAINLP
jgi:hypothetical protein